MITLSNLLFKQNFNLSRYKIIFLSFPRMTFSNVEKKEELKRLSHNFNGKLSGFLEKELVVLECGVISLSGLLALN